MPLRWLVTAFLVPWISAACHGAEMPRRWALLIGVDDYAHAQDLDFCGADQAALYQRLRFCGFEDDQLFLLEDDADDAKYRPSQRNIERQLNVVLNLAAKDDLLVIAFSGHGVSLEGKSYLCPSDATLDDATTLISLHAIYERLGACEARFKLMLVDACRNDPRPGKTRSFTASEETKQLARSLQSVELPQGVVLLNSCAPGEISWEDETLKHGVYMHFVLEALTGAADGNADGAVSLFELQSFAGTKTKIHVARRFSESQRPFFKSEGESDLMELALLPATTKPRPMETPSKPLPPEPVVEGPIKLLTNGIGMKLVLVPNGQFKMGSHEDKSELRRLFVMSSEDEISGETPVHNVTITRPFYIGRTEVTLGQFLTFYHDAGYKVECETDGRGGFGWKGSRGVRSRSYAPWSWGYDGQTMNHPVVNVTWNDAASFCSWLSAKEGKKYRLPSDAEWEYAARSGNDTRFWFGNDTESLTRYDNVADQACRSVFPEPDNVWIANYSPADGANVNSRTRFPFLRGNDGFGYTAPVGSFQPNEFDLCDMHGNVREWCQDYYDADYYAESPINDPQGPRFGTQRVIRGGAFDEQSVGCRVARRYHEPPSMTNYNLGFRVVLEP